MGTILDDGLPDLVADDKYQDAVRCIRMADELTGREWWKEEYYSIANGLLKKLKEDNPDPELKKLSNQVRDKMHRSRALAAAEEYEELCSRMKTAEGSDGYAELADAFQELQQKMKKRKANPKYIPADLQERFAECQHAAEWEAECRKHVNDLYRGKKCRLFLIFTVILAVIVAGVMFVRTSQFDLVVGHAEKMIGDDTRAWQRYKHAYEKSGDESVRELYQTTRYQDGLDCLASGDMDGAYAAFLKLAQEEHYLDSDEYLAQTELLMLSEAEVGDVLQYGDINWEVLDRDGSRVLLIKNKVAEAYVFSDEEQTTWADSDAREYLNGEFMQEHFLDTETAAIVETAVPAEDNTVYGTSSGEDTEDRLYLLSTSEFEKYRELLKKTNNGWWLRNVGAEPGTMVYVDHLQNIMSYGYTTDTDLIRLKPVMWVDTAG